MSSRDLVVTVDRRGAYGARLAKFMEKIPASHANIAWALLDARRSIGRKVKLRICPYRLTLEQLHTIANPPKPTATVHPLVRLGAGRGK